MPKWIASVFVSSQVGSIATEVDAATFEGARQQIHAKHGNVQTISDLRQVTDLKTDSVDNISLDSGATRNLDRIASEIKRASDELAQINEIRLAENLDKAHDEWIESSIELWKACNEDHLDEFGEALKWEEFTLMYGDPFKETFGIDRRPRVNGKVGIECIYCDSSLDILDNRSGKVRCPGCDGVFYADSTIEYDWGWHNKQEKTKRKVRKENIKEMISLSMFFGLPSLFGLYVGGLFGFLAVACILAILWLFAVLTNELENWWNS
jgi:hypothetical protein